MIHRYNDGGRADYFRGDTGDCVTRAIAIAGGYDYKSVYDDLFEMAGETPRNGVKRKVYEKYLLDLCGFNWLPTMQIGSGCTVHLDDDELRTALSGLAHDQWIIARLSKHLSAVHLAEREGDEGEVHDTHNPTRDGTRCVYGIYWRER